MILKARGPTLAATASLARFRRTDGDTDGRGAGSRGALCTLRDRGSREPRLLMAVLGLVASAWIFMELSGAATAQSVHSYDEQLLLALRNPADPSDPWGPPWMEELARDLTALGSVAQLSVMVFISTGFLLLQGKHRVGLFLVISVSSGIAFSLFLKQIYERPRPDLVSHEALTFTSSFPSAHSMAAAIAFLTLGAVLARSQSSNAIKAYLMLTAVLLAFVVGVTRVYLGVHWPSDVVAGWAAGMGWALACWLLARALQRRGALEEEEGK